ncbi:MAG: iron complex outermembrane recepter protein [Candidatus Scalindua rubra]|uniref:Iron complex outermembrane recepter protein n=1 Tax=Candidatus Scalindua rubra TaxID=1872076 RepID=A0A1E3X9V2_9BACT|nr:MAG: iron complex outermembrane recepter protein [Candidatus Scalindua rubra]
MKYHLFILFVVSINFLPSISYSENNFYHEKFAKDQVRNHPSSPPSQGGEQGEVIKDENESLEFEEDIEEIIVTATRTETPVSQLADSITIVSREQIEQQKATTIFEALRSVPGLSIRKSGSIGRITNVTIRGSGTDQVLVMIDGVQVNSPTTGSFNFANLTTDNIERIEVIRGPQSTLYGSDAMGGLINIITRKGKGKPKFGIRSEFGTLERTYNESINSSGSIKKFNYSVDVARVDSDGRGADDDYDKTNISSMFGYKINEKMGFETTMRYNDSMVAIDDGAFRQDPNRFSQNEDFNLNAVYNQSLTDWWSHKLKFSFADADLISIDRLSPGTDETSSSRFRLDTNIYTGDWQHTLKYKDIDTFIFGFEFEDQEADNRNFDKALINRGWYFQNQLKLWDRFFFNAGVRIDDSNTFGKDVNPKFSIAYLLKETDTKFKVNYGKGFRGPTLNQLFFPNFGDPTLKPEESESYDLGFEQYLLEDKLSFGVTYFNNRFSNLIQSTDIGGGVFRAQNIGFVRTEGIETEVVIKPFKGLTLRGTFTKTNTRDGSKKELRRQPRKQGSVNINYSFLDKFNLNVDDTIIGNFREGTNGGGITPTGRPRIRTNTGVHKLDVTLTYDYSGHLQFYTRAENLLDIQYDEILGFRSAGARFFFGLKLSM